VTPLDILIQLIIVVLASLIASIIFPYIFIKIIKHTASSYISTLISDEMKQKFLHSIEEAVKNGFTESLKDPKVKAIINDLLDLLKEKMK
jgi:transcriptional accessory protein Tex/SPT6